MEIPPNVQKILDKNKVLEIVESETDITYWLKPHEQYEMPQKINEIAPNWEGHICKGLHLIRFIK